MPTTNGRRHDSQTTKPAVRGRVGGVSDVVGVSLYLERAAFVTGEPLQTGRRPGQRAAGT
jgi:hypothetical protein